LDILTANRADQESISSHLTNNADIKRSNTVTKAPLIWFHSVKPTFSIFRDSGYMKHTKMLCFQQVSRRVFSPTFTQYHYVTTQQLQYISWKSVNTYYRDSCCVQKLWPRTRCHHCLSYCPNTRQETAYSLVSL